MSTVLAQQLLRAARQLLCDGDVPLNEEDAEQAVPPETPSLTHVEQNVTPFLGPPRTKKLP